MRPVIHDELVNRIEQVNDQHGYESAAEFVRDAVRRRLDDLEVKQKRYQLREETLEELEDLTRGDLELGPEDVVVTGEGPYDMAATLSSRKSRELARQNYEGENNGGDTQNDED